MEFLIAFCVDLKERLSLNLNFLTFNFLLGSSAAIHFYRPDYLNRGYPAPYTYVSRRHSLMIYKKYPVTTFWVPGFLQINLLPVDFLKLHSMKASFSIVEQAMMTA